MTKKHYALFIVISIFTTLLMLLTFNYSDGQTLLAWSLSIEDTLFEGRPMDFYWEKLRNIRGAIQNDGCDSPLMLIPLAIWNLPVWLTHYFNGNLFVGTPACIIWDKMFFFLLTIATGLLSNKIIFEQTNDKEKGILGFILTVGSAELMLSTMYAGQDEIVYLFFLQLAYYYLIKDKRIWFLVWGICSVVCCPIMIIPYVVLVTLREKRVLFIILDSVLALLPNMLWNLISRNAPYKAETVLSTGSYIDDVLNLIEFPTATGFASVGVAIFVIIFFIAYFTKEYDFRKYTWIYAATMIVVTFLMWNYFYRFCLYVPILVILIMTNKTHENFKLNLVLITVLEYVRMITGDFESPQNMCTSYVMRSRLMNKLLEITGSNGAEMYRYPMGKIVERVPEVASIIPALNAVAIVCVGLLLYINSSKCKRSYNMPTIRVNVVLAAYVLYMPLTMILFYMILFR